MDPRDGQALPGWKAVGLGSEIYWTTGKAALPRPTPAWVPGDGGAELISTNARRELSSGNRASVMRGGGEFMVGKSHAGQLVGLDCRGEGELIEYYAIQIFDSYGRGEAGKRGIGGRLSETPPLVNRVQETGEWQTGSIVFARAFVSGGPEDCDATFVSDGDVCVERPTGGECGDCATGRTEP